MDFYYAAASPPCRSVLMTAKALGIELNLKPTDVMKGENLTPEYLKMNPQHTVPTLNDNGFCLWESRAILVYLVEKYGKGSTLYPSDPKSRAIVNQRLYFDMGTLYHRFSEYFYPQFFAKAPADPEKFQKLEEALGWLNTFLEGHKYVAGEHLTIADLALVATVSNFELIKDLDFNKFPNVARWYKLMKETAPGYSLNQDGFKQFKEIMSKLK